jgi:hexosaminidase
VIWNQIIPSVQQLTPIESPTGLSLPNTLLVWSEVTDFLPTLEAGLHRANRINPKSQVQWALADTADDALITLVSNTELEQHWYELQVTDHGIQLRASSITGVSSGLATLVQAVLLSVGAFQGAGKPKQQVARLEHVTILDYPAYPWRGFMLDVARHFFPVESLEKVLDMLWLLRLNRFHLHLTDDQGWRFPVEGYPRLTEVGAWRSDQTSDLGLYGGHYQKEELKSLDTSAQKLGITLVPEIDLPGHASSVLAAYPQVGVGLEDPQASVPGGAPQVETRWGIFQRVISPVSEESFRFVQTVLSEVAQTFQGDWIHIGGDEVLTDSWQPLHKEFGSDEQLYQQIIGHMADSVIRLGKTPLVWDEASRLDLPPTTIIANWREPEFAQAALERGYRIVLCPQGRRTYLDHKHTSSGLEAGRLSVCTVKDSSMFDPLRYVSESIVGSSISYSTSTSTSNSTPKPGKASTPSFHEPKVLGGQGNLWTEGVSSHRQIEYMAYVRLAALSQGLWTGVPAADSWEQEFASRIDSWRTLFFSFGYSVYPGILEEIQVESEQSYEPSRPNKPNEVNEIDTPNPIGSKI